MEAITVCITTWSVLVYIEKENISFRFLFSRYKYILNLYQSHQYLSLIQYITFSVGAVVALIVW